MPGDPAGPSITLTYFLALVFAAPAFFGRAVFPVVAAFVAGFVAVFAAALVAGLAVAFAGWATSPAAGFATARVPDLVGAFAAALEAAFVGAFFELAAIRYSLLTAEIIYEGSCPFVNRDYETQTQTSPKLR